MYIIQYPFPTGRLLLGKSEKGLRLVHYLRPEQDSRRFLDSLPGGTAPPIEDRGRFRREIELFDRYFAGEAEDFRSLILDIAFGTPNQRRVWMETRKIPYGQTAAYRDIAHRMHHRGYRFIGQALHKNPYLIVIPCHRVIGADGGLGGFGAGLELKRFLLRIEGIPII